jgi:HEAT repeat protein
MDIASQLQRRTGAGSTGHALEETQKLLLAGLHDPHHEVVRAAVSGLGHRPHPAALDELIRLSSHPDDLLRWKVAVSLGSYQQPSAIDALLRLATDPDADVRDWATFGLGTLQTSDSPEIRAALWRNLSDTDEDVRGEALLGLAARRDERAIEYLLEHLNPQCRVYELDAAETLANPRLLGALQAISSAMPDDATNSYWSSRLKSAIAACLVE